MSVPQWARPFRFQKAGLGLLPLLERADRDLLLEQRSRSCGGDAMQPQFALRGQQAIRCRRAHGKQLASALLCQVEVLIPLQCFNERGEKGDEVFGADAVDAFQARKSACWTSGP